MTLDVPKKLPQFVYREKTRHTRWVYYFRRGKGKRIRLPDYGAEDFDERYHEVLVEAIPPKPKKAGTGSLEWLIARYRESTAYTELSNATRRQRDNIFKNVIAKNGHVAYRAVSRKKIVEARDARASTPAQARNFLDAMRGLFRWALEAEHVNEDPTDGVKNPSRPKGAGFEAWTDEDVAAFEKRWKAGTKERVWLHVLLYTGLRRGDAVRLGKQHVRDGVATLRTEKTGMEVYITIRPELSATLAAGPTGDLAFIVGDTRKPLTKESFGNMFRVACNEAGIPGKSAHGVRKIAATRAAEAGLTVSELESVFGWTGGTMASHYTRSADRRRLAKAAGEKIANKNRPHHRQVLPRTRKK